MKTITIQAYQFSELSDKAKQRAIEDYRNSHTEVFWADENRQSMEAFADMLPIKVTDWSYGGRGEGVSWEWRTDYDIESMTGKRLVAYIYNNFGSTIFGPKYLKHLKMTDTPMRHKRVRSTRIQSGPNKDKWMNVYYSGCQTECSCPFTGYYMDMELLNPFLEYLKKPDGRTFEDLINESFDAWVKACNEDIEYQNSDEAITESIEANEYDFDVYGDIL